MLRVWIRPVALVFSGAVVSAVLLSGGKPVLGVALLLLFVLWAGANSPLAYPASTGAREARRRSASDGRPIVYWRPGCPFCLRLRLRIGREARQLYWVNIWRDADGAADVRAANDGDETVPTVVVAGESHVNPDPAWVRARLTGPN
ncbi:hypothetical protein E0L36_00070 [Streptomyces sp. AJS327]|uniref:glutaredoxin domain-containing protein n=1 Tax=Streptomyces sp. AJS327 TaxID=2545265 RepID=UPI0015DDA7FA|nr:glutaredoxin domain-containing protein [Streptomyces sp. AJS327]MBA0049365.1 hypothetical protein [Streptomyces sp. AJS327]